MDPQTSGSCRCQNDLGYCYDRSHLSVSKDIHMKNLGRAVEVLVDNSKQRQNSK